VADDLVAGAVAELYGADPDAFTERRKALVAAAREAGDRDSASAIAALRKPTRAAWVVNRLARAEPSAAGRLADLASELRAAEAAKDGRRLRELSADRGALIDALTADALAAAGVPDPPSSLREEVTATLTAALADPATAAAFAAGSLTKAAQWSGFGYGDFAAVDEPAPDGARSPGASDPAPVDIASRRAGRARPATESGSGSRGAALAEPAERTAPTRPAAAPRPTRLPRQADRAKIGRAEVAHEQSQRAAREQSRREAEEQRAAEAEQRAAEAAAERAAQAQEKFEEAERFLAQASAVAAEAGAAEDRLEAEVRDLEGRLTTARDELAAARRHARHAEAAERRARQALDRVPRP
jgi:hypothetical protein